MRSVSLLAVLAATALIAPPRAGAQDARAQLDAAQAELRQTMIERGRDRLQRLIAEFPSAPSAVLAEAHFLLGVSHLALRTADSVAPHFAAAVRLDPFHAPDERLYNPDVVAAYGRAHRQTAALGIRGPADTTLQPRQDSLRLRVALGRPGQVSVRLGRDNAAGRVLAEFEATHAFDLAVPLLVGPDSPLEPGTYQVSGRFVGPDGDTATTRLAVSITRLTADTTLHEAPLDSTQLRPESRPGGMPITSLLAGVAVGAVSAALPMVLWNPDLGSAEMRPGALAVGAAVTVGGIVGMLTGRPEVPIAENIQYNQDRLRAWTDRNAAITRQNEEARRFAPLRITTGGAP